MEKSVNIRYVLGMTTLPDISVAPMMDWTDRHCRVFLRLIAPHVRLYTEMVTTGAILHGDKKRLLDFDAAEHPLALQLGGSDPDALAECAKIGADWGYNEINLNCGCPSDRVQNGSFGACLMKSPDLVARGVERMIAAVDVPVTVKCRIGVDECDDRAFLDRFVKTVSSAGCETFIVHARKAWLQGLSPKENRDIPPLNYDLVAEVKAAYPRLRFIVNGGIKTTADIQNHLAAFDGVMIGREAYQNPYSLADIEREIFGNDNVLSRVEVVRAMIPYIERMGRENGTPVKSITRHMLGLFNGLRGARHWRRVLSTEAVKDGAMAQVIEGALS